MKIKKFTLIELITVIVIIAISSAIVAAQMNWNSSSLKLKRQCHEIEQLFLDARILALNGGQNTLVVLIENNDNKYEIMLFNKIKKIKKISLIKNIRIISYNTISKENKFLNNQKLLKIQGTIKHVWSFLNDGRVTGEDIDIYLGKRRWKLDISNLTGNISVYEVQNKKK